MSFTVGTGQLIMDNVMRYVCKHRDEWAVWKEGASKPSVLFSDLDGAERRAIQIVARAGGGEVQIRTDYQTRTVKVAPNL